MSWDFDKLKPYTLFQDPLEAEEHMQIAALQGELKAAQGRQGAALQESASLQAKCVHLESERVRLEARVRSQVIRFAEWKGHFDGLYQVRVFLCTVEVPKHLTKMQRANFLSESQSTL